MNGNINVVATGYCEKCPYMSLDINPMRIFADSEETTASKQVFCRNRQLCERLLAYFMEASDNG